MKRVVGIDFGPRNTAICVARFEDCALRAIETWTLVDVTAELRESAADATSCSLTETLPSGWEKQSRDALVATLEPWFAAEPALRDEVAACATKKALVAWIRPRNATKRSAATLARAAAAPKSFYSGYVRIAHSLADQLDAIAAVAPIDLVTCEHQPAMTRYENIVLEAMVVQHCVARGWFVETMHPGRKYKGFEALRPASTPAARGNSFRQRLFLERMKHALNKWVSIRCCAALLNAFHLPALDAVDATDKQDDLADALLLAYQGALTRTWVHPPSVSDQSSSQLQSTQTPPPRPTTTRPRKRTKTPRSSPRTRPRTR